MLIYESDSQPQTLGGSGPPQRLARARVQESGPVQYSPGIGIHRLAAKPEGWGWGWGGGGLRDKPRSVGCIWLWDCSRALLMLWKQAPYTTQKAAAKGANARRLRPAKVASAGA